jgi:hypothetical protein
MRQAIKVGRFEQFVRVPTLDRFQKLQQALFACDDYHPWSHDLRNLEQLLVQREFVSVMQCADEQLRLWQLSPRFHFVVGQAAVELGDPGRVEWEKRASRACLRQLLATGDGTSDSPYQITYPSDEYDILAALGVESRCQQLVQAADGPCDVLTLHDGTDLWFDVSPMFAIKTGSLTGSAER